MVAFGGLGGLWSTSSQKRAHLYDVLSLDMMWVPPSNKPTKSQRINSSPALHYLASKLTCLQDQNFTAITTKKKIGFQDKGPLTCMGLLAAGTHSALWSWRWPSALWQPLGRLQGPRRSHWAEPVRNREITFIMGQSKWFRKEPSPSGKQGLLGVSQHNRWLWWRCSMAQLGRKKHQETRFSLKS